MNDSILFLPGVQAEKVTAALCRAGGSELSTGKFQNPESSAALACNTFGAFLDAPELLPPLPHLGDLDWPAVKVDVEREVRFPWRGGRHPWLDAAIETNKHIIGVESKRFEPFRDAKSVSLSGAYDRPVWGEGMEAFCLLRDELRSGVASFLYLDACQLVKHAFGLVTEAERVDKAPVLFYLFAEPTARGSTPIPRSAIREHRWEVERFARTVAGSRVRFAASSYRGWLETWSGQASRHAEAVQERFQP